jgi:hypothetical protein
MADRVLLTAIVHARCHSCARRNGEKDSNGPVAIARAIDGLDARLAPDFLFSPTGELPAPALAPHSPGVLVDWRYACATMRG